MIVQVITDGLEAPGGIGHLAKTKASKPAAMTHNKQFQTTGEPCITQSHPTSSADPESYLIAGKTGKLKGNYKGEREGKHQINASPSLLKTFTQNELVL